MGLPFPLSRESLFRMNANVSFSIPNMVLKSKIAAPLSFAPSGRLAFRWGPLGSQSVIDLAPPLLEEVSALDLDLDSCLPSGHIVKCTSNSAMTTSPLLFASAD